MTILSFHKKKKKLKKRKNYLTPEGLLTYLQVLFMDCSGGNSVKVL